MSWGFGIGRLEIVLLGHRLIRNASAIGITILVLFTASIAAYAKPARCLIEVDGRAYTFGQCNADREKDGSLSVGTGDASRSPIFAIVNASEGGAADGYWNEEPRASHAQSPLGTMRKSGGCWVNERAKVCAWPVR